MVSSCLSTHSKAAPTFGRLVMEPEAFKETQVDLQKGWEDLKQQVTELQKEANIEVTTEHLDQVTFTDDQLKPQLTSTYRRYRLFDSLIRHFMRSFDFATIKHEHSGTLTPTKNTPVIVVETIRHFSPAQAVRYANSMNQKIVKYNADLMALVNQHIASQSSTGRSNDDTNPIFKKLLAKGHFTICLLLQSVFDKLQACFGVGKPLPLVGQDQVILPSSVDAKLTHTVTINYLIDDEGDQSGGSGSPSVGPIHDKSYTGPRLTFTDIDTMVKASEANIRKNQKVPYEAPVFNEN